MKVRRDERYPSWYEAGLRMSSKGAPMLIRRRGQISG